MEKLKHHRISTIAMSILFGMSCALASTLTTPPTTPPPIPPLDTSNGGKLERQPNPKRHRSPSNVYLTYQYTGEGIYVFPCETHIQYDVCVYGLNDGYDIEATLSPEEGYFVETGALYGEYTITATTPDGAVFTGTLIAE